VTVRSVRRTAALAVAAVGAAGVVVGCSSTPSARPAADAYLAAWSRGDIAAAAAGTDNPNAATTALTDARTRLHLTAVTARTTDVKTKGTTATATFHATLAVGGLGPWAYDGTFALARAAGKWQVTWRISNVHPQLQDGQHLARTRTLSPRANLLDRAGRPLFGRQEIVVVTIDPKRFAGGPAELKTLASAVGVDAAALGKQLAAAGSAAVPVIRLRRSDYDKVKAKIHDLPGVVFPTTTAQLAPSRSFGRQLLGTVGPATVDALKTAGPAYAATDQLGLGGLQGAYQARLAGTPSGSVVIGDATGRTVTTLQTFTGKPGADVRTTLDRTVQLAAENALDAATVQTAALVVVRPSDGSILAVANRPTESSLDRALVGRYPPGSTFKVVTTYDLLRGQVTPTTPVPCPPTITVNGKVFKNFEGETSSGATFADDFALSCNTAFISLARKQNTAAFGTTTKDLGFGGTWSLPVPAFTGDIPTPTSDVQHVAQAIGQGRDLVSPLGMALVAAAVQAGTWRAPVLVTSPAQTPAPTAKQLDASRIATLRTLMTRVVRSGTAASAHLPPGTAGKTGTAEFGVGNAVKTHAWFIGYRGDLAFAVLVEGGGVGGRVAAPIAARFLASLTH
jgi:cell division protein FtsI/penicillin-binding protein 2